VNHSRGGFLMLAGIALIAAGGPGGTSAGAPALVVAVSSPTHLYNATLPSGWTSALGATTVAPDKLSGAEGSIEVRVSAIPQGMSADAWIDTYLDERSADFASGCLSGGGATREAAKLGSEPASLFSLPCLAGWMLIAASNQRIYDLRFTDSSGAATAAGKATFQAITGSIVVQAGTLSSRALSPSTSL
jgi:hypothetical protein